MKTKQFFAILTSGLTIALVTLLSPTFAPIQAYPNLNVTVTPTPETLSATVKTERLLQSRSETGSLSATSGIVNGDFESGRTGWNEYSRYGWSIILHRDSLPVSPQSGNWAAWLGGSYDEISYISQTITIPTGSITLTYWEWIASQDTCGRDFAWVRINNTNVQTINLCGSNNTNGWIQRTVNLSAYAGQTVSLQIRVETDSSLNSNYFVDNMVLSGTTGQHYVYLPLAMRDFWAGYFDDFSNPNSGWCVVDNPDRKMGYVSGEFQIMIKNPNIGYMCVPVKIPISNYRVEVDARMVSSNAGSYSLVFGIRWGQNTRENYVVSVEPYTRYYRIQRRNMDGTWTTLVNWTYSSLINFGMQTNRLRIDRIGSYIWFSVNGFFVTSVSDSNIVGTGLGAGVGVNSYNNVPVDVRFDNFRASQP